MKRIYPIESMRAFASLGVFLCHFKGAFFPNSIYIKLLMDTPANILFAGNTFVRIMFLISGLVLSYKYYSYECFEQIQYDILKRYLRLGIPCFFACMFSYLLMKFDLMMNVETAVLTHSEGFFGIFNNFESDFGLFMKEGIYGALFLGSSLYVGPMWTMMYEMLGSLLVLSAIAVLKNNQKMRILFYSAFLLLYQNYYAYFILGMMIADYLCHFNKANWSWKQEGLCLFCLLLSGLYICHPKNIGEHFWLFSIACLIMFPCFIKSRLVNKVFGEKNKVCMWLGKNSFAVYLIHWPIMESFSCRIYVKFLKLSGHRLAVVATFVVSLLVILLLADVFRRYVEWVTKITERSLEKVLH